MDSGYYATVTGMVARMNTLDVAANNLANVSTTGYKAQDESYTSLTAGAGKQRLTSLNRTVNDNGVLSGASLDLSGGALERTGNELDVGLESSGYFVV